MSEPTVSHKPVREKPTREVEVNDLAELVAQASRFLTAISSMPPFKPGEVGLAEWVALSTLAEQDGIGDRQLAKRLGVSEQRAAQITTSLSSAKLIAVSPSSQDSSKKVVALTEAGRDAVSKLNGSVTPLIDAALKGKKNSLARLNKSFRVMRNLVEPARTEKKRARAERTGRSRTEGGETAPIEGGTEAR